MKRALVDIQSNYNVRRVVWLLKKHILIIILD